MKVLHVIEGIDSRLGGLPAAMFSINKLEKELNIYSHILSISNDETDVIYHNIYHLFPSSFPKRFNKSSRAMNWLEDHIDEFDLIIIHGFWNFLCIQTALIAFNKKKKYVIWPHGSLDPFDLRKKKMLKDVVGKLICSKILQNAYTLCFTSLQESLRVETYGAIINKTILPLPVDSVEYGQPSDIDFRNKYAIKTNEFVFLFLGRINYKKGLDFLIEATKKICVDYKSIKILIAGYDNTEYGQICKDLVNSFNLDSIITFCGELKGSEKSIAFQICNCFVLPSLNENFGIAVIEALQHSLPVIISDNVYTWKEIESMQGGWVCHANTESLIDSMKLVLSDKDDYVRKKLSAKAAGDFFLPKNLIKLYENFYSQTMGE